MGTKSRRSARELALNILYQVDVAKIPPDEAIRTAVANTSIEVSDTEFAIALVEGTIENQKQFDDVLRKLSVGWELQRQPAVDRNILRMAMFEITYLAEVPTSVTINEAVELAKKYSTDESGRFVNGVLGSFVRQNDVKHGEEGQDGCPIA